MNIKNKDLEFKKSDIIIMEQPGYLGVFETHQKFLEYANQNLNELFYQKGENSQPSPFLALWFRYDCAYSEILTGVIIFFLIGSEFFINYKVMVNKNHGFFKKKAKKDVKEVL